ncbi:nucleotidyltransferase family protein [Immundisolibacter sp.]|uniref:nucleotidyltransferase family protein n=1 Tax=Immundisolibacter sp. TaxID=1934948 RepID=UPI002636675F|nr:nucleotidyltransferase family protein [Immundisolibacter sp.]MDD3650439.1 nucleotidyltransferase family protein [Immundisolibacter sp.]
MTAPTVGILLAAGAGTRFGGDKLLAPLHGRPLVLHALAALQTAVDGVIAAVRPGDDALRAILHAAGARVVICPQAADGMGHSLACAARQVPAGHQGLVALGDMPAIQPGTMRRVREALEAGAAIAVPVYCGRRGHPVGFAAQVVPALTALGGDQGARALLLQHRGEVLEVPVDDAGIVADVDTPADLASVGARPRPANC